MLKPFDIDPGKFQNFNYSGQLYEINQNVCKGNSLMEGYANYVDLRINELSKKRKKSCITHTISLSNTGEILINSLYDDNTHESDIFILNLRGGWSVYRLEFKKTEQKTEKFAIFFETQSHCIIGDIKKNTANGLFTYFVRAGVSFNDRICEQTVKKALFATFGPQIENCVNKITIPELAGWNNNIFMYEENFYFTRGQDFPDLPILNKHFEVANDVKKAEKYLQSLCGITQWRNRVIVLLIPVVGILSSLLAEQEVENICFNAVGINRKNARFLPRLLQVFNRYISEIVDMEGTDKELCKALSKCNDEVIIVDILSDDGTAYQKKKRRENAKKLVEKVCLNSGAVFGIQRNIQCSILVLNGSIWESSAAINLFVDDDFYCAKNRIEDALEEKQIEAFFTVFIKFVEENMNIVKGKIQQIKRLTTNNNLLSLTVAWKILMEFCNAEGLDLNLMLKLPSKIDFSEFLQDELEPDDLQDVFVELIRGEIKKWKIKQKLEKISPNDASNSCFYDDEYLYIPTKILDRMLGRNRYLPRKFEILSALREAKCLKVNSEGLSCRLQICGMRFETYKFRRELFEKVGAVDIIYLGRGDE